MTMGAIKSLTDSWLWSAKGFPFFLFKRFKGNKINLNERAWLPFFEFPFMADMLGGAEGSKLSRFPPAHEKKKNLWKSLRMFWRPWANRTCATVAPCETKKELLVQTIQPLFGFCSLFLSAREEHKHASAAHFCYRTHLRLCSWIHIDGTRWKVLLLWYILLWY